jgi:UDPglucose 6-dehydrogenase
MKVGVVGCGVVGHATARSYMEFGEVRVFDVLKERRTHSLEETLACDVVFVCLPTPQAEGHLYADCRAVDDFFRLQQGSAAHFCLRSTVPIGTTRRLRERYDLPNITHSPEFLTARCAATDAQLPSRNIIGIPGPITDEKLPLYDLYYERFPGVPILEMTSNESEAVKLVLNSFFAVKVAFFNEANTLAKKFGLDWERVMEGVLSDGRIAHAHTRVPGPSGGFGFGGVCLPKDLASFAAQLQSAGLRADVSTAALLRNREDRKR